MNFKVGQKVICIKKGRWIKSIDKSPSYGPNYLEECEVKEAYLDSQNIPCIYIVGYEGGFWSKRFRPLANMGIEELLERIKNEQELLEFVK